MNAATLSRDPFMPRAPKVRGRALGLAVLAHVALVLALAFGVNWRSDEPATVAAELWSVTPQAAAPRAVEPAPTAPPAPPEVRKVEPKPPEPVVARPPTPALPDPQIAIEKARREDTKRVTAELEEQKKARREKAEREKEELVLKKEKVDKLKAEQAKVEQAKVEQATRCKQAQRGDTHGQRVPVETAADIEDFPFAVALRASAAAQRIGVLLHQQGLASGYQVDRSQRLGGELTLESVRLQFHQLFGRSTMSRRRRIAACISRRSSRWISSCSAGLPDEELMS